MCGCQREAPQCLLGGEQSARGGGGVGGDGGGKPLPLSLPMGCGEVLRGLKLATGPTSLVGEFCGLVGAGGKSLCPFLSMQTDPCVSYQHF